MVAQVSKHFRIIALDKLLWISLIRDLQFRGLLELPPDEDFQSYCTTDLIDEVKHIVRGPKTWSPTYSAGGNIRREIVIPLGKAVSGKGRVKVFRGGRYFAVQEGPCLRFYDKATARCVREVPFGNADSIQDWSIDMHAGGKSLTAIVTLFGPAR